MLRLLVMVLFLAAIYQAARRPDPADEGSRRLKATTCTLTALLALCWV